MSQHRKSFVVRSLAEYEALSPRELETRRAAFHALDLMRKGVPLAKAARLAGTTSAAVVSHVGQALERKGGRWVARPADRLLRVMQVLAVGGVEHRVVVRGSRIASLVGGHWWAIRHYLETGDTSRLDRFRGTRVLGYELETDLDVIDAWAPRGGVDVEKYYSLLS
jgi:hypothetical protein